MNAFVADLFSLDGRVALVTGASSGIGRHSAGVLARAGARVVLVARRAEALERVVAEIAESGGEARALPWDVGDLEGLAALVGA